MKSLLKAAMLLGPDLQSPYRRIFWIRQSGQGCLRLTIRSPSSKAAQWGALTACGDRCLGTAYTQGQWWSRRDIQNPCLGTVHRDRSESKSHVDNYLSCVQQNQAGRDTSPAKC